MLHINYLIEDIYANGSTMDLLFTFLYTSAVRG